jgi:non-ribosomal peptide synthetase component F
MGTAVMSTAVMSTVAMDAAAEEPLDVDVLSPACVLCSPGQTAARVLSHQGIANMASHFAAELAAGLGTGAIALADFSSFGFLLEFFVPMSSGGRVVIAPDDVRAGGTALGDFMAHHGVEIVQVPPGVPARILDDAVDRVPRLRIVARAEDLQPALTRRFLAAGCELRSVFGDVETGGWAISGLVDDTLELTAGRLATGRPIANTRAFIVAPDGRELPVGVRGELCLAGSGVAAEPYYQTRELARWRPDGTIERLGQMGSQVVAAEQPDDAAEHQLQDAKDPVLEKLVALWRDLLTTDVSAQTNFFTAGGHSLMAAKLAQDIEQFTGVHLELTDVFDHPTPAGIAVRLKELEQTICTGVPQ